MATLTSTKIKNTYDALLKSIDNDAIGTTAKQITDGLGNITPLLCINNTNRNRCNARNRIKPSRFWRC